MTVTDNKMTLTDSRGSKGGPNEAKERSLLEIATKFRKRINDAEEEDRQYEIGDYHSAIFKRVRGLSGLTAEKEIIEMFDPRHRQCSELFMEQCAGHRHLIYGVMQRAGVKQLQEQGGESSGEAQFLQELILNYPQILTKSLDENYPLDWAAKKSKLSVFLILGLIVPQETLNSLKRNTCDQTSRLASTQRLEEDVATQCDIRLNSFLIKRFQKSRDDGGKGCLHQQIDEKRLADWNTNFRRILSKVLSVRDDDSNQNRKTACLHSLLNNDELFIVENAKEVVETLREFIGLCPKELIEAHDEDGFTPLHKAIQLYEWGNFDFQMLNDVINSLIEKSPESMYTRVEGKPTGLHFNKTPFMLLGDLEPKSNPSFKFNKALEYHISMRQGLKHLCVGGGRRREEKLEYLYGNSKKAPKLFLDFAHVNGGVDESYTEMLSQKVSQRFDSVLDYVRLPRIHQEFMQPQPASGTRSVIQHVGRKAEKETTNPYSAIFRWLENQKVEKIFRIDVDDLGDQTHSDEAIVEALKPFNIETWDWKKFDMCSHTIWEAAPNVRQLFLHASGNNAVLRSWSSKSGLAELKNLERITITMYPGKRESRKILKGYLEDFKRSFRLHSGVQPPEIVINGLDDDSNESWPSKDHVIEIHNTIQQSESHWIRNLASLRDALQDWSDQDEDNDDDEDNENGRPRVKIALIDNGVNIRHPEVGGITMGESFSNPDGQPGFRDYYADPSVHGTQMAICIRKVCPMAKLYVARLDDPSSPSFVSSATKAIEWAMKIGVDIISMSWTFNQKHPDGAETSVFAKKIEDAAKKPTLLFAALNDNKPDSDVNEFYPVGLKEVLKIGSAKKWGAKSEFAQSGKSDYLFPGEDIELTGVEGETLHPTGSSLATAFAAGMAGLVLYSMKAHLHMVADSEAPKEAHKTRLKVASTRDGMSKIFNILAGIPAGDGTHKDVPVAFKESAFPQFAHLTKEEQKGKLGDFLARISPTY